MENPFKFGTIVAGEYFTDRKEETIQLVNALNSRNHVIIISPRRYGKSSLVAHALMQTNRLSMTVNLQSVTSTSDFAATLIRRAFKLFPFERVKYLISHFRIIPTLSVNPLNNGVDVSFQPMIAGDVMLEDALDMLNKLGEKRRLVVVFDEFQEILSIEKNLDKKLRAVMQTHENINYVMLGSQESMMAGIFERKRSPFYHFGILMRIKRIPHEELLEFLSLRFGAKDIADAKELSRQVLSFTNCHPYYTQQLAFHVWNILSSSSNNCEVVDKAVRDVVQLHDYDYERLWATIGKTDKNTLIRLATANRISRPQPPSTVQSSLKRLCREGLVLKNDSYQIDDPFFAKWIIGQIE
ncbi:MAG: ATP-binding protein [Muribaculaceae bacterium]|nr:ATP-binding protein [Muribaculaceae bacterium]